MVSSWWALPLWGILFDLLLILLLILINGLFAYAEIAILSAKKVRLQQFAKHHPGARSALQLANEPTDFLSTVQIGITLIGILAGALGSATVAEQLAVWFVTLPYIGDYAEVLSISIVVLIVTYLSLTLGELTPKALALTNPERGAMLMARPLQLLSSLTLPLVRILSFSTEWLLRRLQIEQNRPLPVTEEELKALALEGAAAGVLEPIEQSMVERALNWDDISLRPLVTHRTLVEWLDVNDTPLAIRDYIAAHEHTWFPLCEGDLDNAVGVVRARDVLLAMESHPPSSPQVSSIADTLRQLAYPPLFVPLTTSPVKVLDLFRSHHAHVAFAVDEYGGIEGIVTPFDMLEALVGAISTSEPRASSR